MDAKTPKYDMHSSYERLIRLVCIARGLEMGGIYNAAKLFWALAYSQEIQDSNECILASTPQELEREIEAVISDLRSSGENEKLIAAIRSGQLAAQENRTIPYSEIPSTYVCRACGEILLETSPTDCPKCGAEALSLREFPPVYYLEPLFPEQALAALESAPEEIELMLQGLDSKRLSDPLQPGEWSFRDLLFHLFLAQELLATRVEKMLSEQNPVLKSLAAWAVENQDQLSTEQLFEKYRASRQATLKRLKEADAEDWLRTGQHDEFGDITILQQASYFAKHERSHFPQFKVIRQSLDRP